MKNYLISVGVNRLDKSYYQGKIHELACCNKDAEDVFDYFTERYEFYSQDLFTDCNSRILRAQLDYLSESLKADDNLILFYSGHGGQVTDFNDDEQQDVYDETWCLKDKQMIDDEIFNAFAKFEKGVNILVLSDSCHSGSIVRAFETDQRKKRLSKKVGYKKSQLLFDLNKEKHKAVFDLKMVGENEIGANVILLSGCQDDESAYAGNPNSQFTDALLKILKETEDEIRLEDLQETLKGVLRGYPYRQTPNFKIYGKAGDELAAQTISERLRQKKEKIKRETKKPADVWNKKLYVETSGTALNSKTGDSFEILSAAESTGQDVVYTLEFNKEGVENGWEAAHIVRRELQEKGIDLAVFPIFDLEQEDVDKEYAKTTAEGFEDFLQNWPPYSKNIPHPFDWYKKTNYSQLEDALAHVTAEVSKEELNIRIGHIDSGYYPDHPSTPENVNKKLSKSFIPGESDSKGVVKLSSKGQALHGVATLALLAGKKIKPEEKIFRGYEGVMGAIPFAEIICLRIANKVHFSDPKILNSFAQAVDYAIDNGCKVVTMSMGGLSSKSMARVVNRAYEKGVVFVSAAGNNFNTWWDFAIPEHLIYPARYARVLAVAGAAYDQRPYDFSIRKEDVKGGFDLNRMQGNSGPEPAMFNAIAAYTPNVPWADIILEDDQVKKFVVSPRGGGTSSATPQIAAAVGLWLVKYKAQLIEKGYWNNWRCVEAVKDALRKSADWRSFPESRQYYGMGILKALDALQISPGDISDGQMAPPARRRSIFSLYKSVEEEPELTPYQEMINGEMEYLLSLDKTVLQEYQAGASAKSEVEDWIKRHPLASETLKKMFN